MSKQKIGTGDAVGDSIAQAQSYAAQGDYSNAIVACQAAVSAAYTAESSLAQQPQMSAVTNAKSAVDPLAADAQTCLGDPLYAGCPSQSDYASALSWAQAAYAAVQADSALNNVPPPTPGTTLQQLAQNVVDAYPAGGCTNPLLAGSPLYQAVAAFKTGWLAAGKGGGVTHNGKYDQACADAVTATLGAAAPAPCADGGGPPPVKTCPAGQMLDASGNCVPVPAPVKKFPTWAKILIGVAIVGVLGAALWWAFGTEHGKKTLGLQAAEKKKKKAKATKKK